MSVVFAIDGFRRSASPDQTRQVPLSDWKRLPFEFQKLFSLSFAAGRFQPLNVSLPLFGIWIDMMGSASHS